MDAETVVGELWDRIQARDWPGLGRLLADAREYWTSPGSDQPPDWRRPYTDHR